MPNKRINGRQLGKLFLLPLVLFFLCSGISERRTGDLSSAKEKKQALHALRKAKRVESERIGFAAFPSENYQNAKKLWKCSTARELVLLTSDRAPVVRCYAFLGLMEKQYDSLQVKIIAEKHGRSDTEKVEMMNGCISSKTTVGEYMQMKSSGYCIDANCRQKLDSALRMEK